MRPQKQHPTLAKVLRMRPPMSSTARPNYPTAAITKLLNGLDVDKVIAATESYHEKTGKDITATINFLNKLKSLRDDK